MPRLMIAVILTLIGAVTNPAAAYAGYRSELCVEKSLFGKVTVECVQVWVSEPGDPPVEAGEPVPQVPGCVPVERDGIMIGCLEPLAVAEPIAVVDVQGAAARAAGSLEVPSPVVRVGPDPAWNKWNALAVGLPVWVWTDSQDPVSTSVTEQGIQIDMTASRGAVTVDWGDGTVTTCYSMTPRPINIRPMTKSPDCGHVYQKRGDYTITVTASWQVDWAALGQAGQVGLESSGGYGLRVSEFESVVVG